MLMVEANPLKMLIDGLVLTRAKVLIRLSVLVFVSGVP